MIRAIIFDFDGVILDSVDIKTKAFARLFEEHGPEVQREVLAHHLAHGGISRFKKFAHIYEHILRRPMPDGESERLGERFSELVFDEVVKAAWIPGAPEFLEENHARYQCFIASGTPQEELERIIRYRDLASFFVEVFGSPAPKAEIIRLILGKYGIANDEAVFVGDAMSDFEATEACKIDFIGIQPVGDKVFPAGTTVLPNMRGLEQIIAKCKT